MKCASEVSAIRASAGTSSGLSNDRSILSRARSMRRLAASTRTTRTTLAGARGPASYPGSPRPMTPVMRAAFLVSLFLALWLLPAAGAAASSGPCFRGAHGAPCRFQSARVTEVNDGDTITVRLSGSRRERKVRFRAIQAMELTRYSPRRSQRRGECHGVAAANRLEDLIRAGHKRVRLSSQHPGT